MGRLARLVFPGLLHHVTQRGNGRAQTFFDDADYVLYRDLLAASCRAANVEIWSWVLMPNHVHLILTPRGRGWDQACLGAGPSRLCRRHPRPAKANRAFLAGPLRRRGDGRKHIWRQRCGMWHSIRSGRGSSTKRRPGPGRACARICRAKKTASRRSRRCSVAFLALPSSSLGTPTATCSRACAVLSMSAALWAAMPSSRSWRRSPSESSS